jgi:hypothetical protein
VRSVTNEAEPVLLDDGGGAGGDGGDGGDGGVGADIDPQAYLERILDTIALCQLAIRTDTSAWCWQVATIVVVVVVVDVDGGGGGNILDGVVADHELLDRIQSTVCGWIACNVQRAGARSATARCTSTIGVCDGEETGLVCD